MSDAHSRRYCPYAFYIMTLKSALMLKFVSAGMTRHLVYILNNLKAHPPQCALHEFFTMYIDMFHTSSARF